MTTAYVRWLDDERQRVEALAKKRLAYRELPYGIYIESPDLCVWFNRRHEPIARFRNGQFVAWIDPATRIAFTGQAWFYNDQTSPRFDHETRKRLMTMVRDFLPFTPKPAKAA